MKTLELKFVNEQNKQVTVTLEQPIEPADPVVIEAAMDAIIAENVFFSAGGDLVGKHSARIVERNVFDIEM